MPSEETSAFLSLCLGEPKDWPGWCVATAALIFLKYQGSLIKDIYISHTDGSILLIRIGRTSKCNTNSETPLTLTLA